MHEIVCYFTFFAVLRESTKTATENDEQFSEIMQDLKLGQEYIIEVLLYVDYAIFKKVGHHSIRHRLCHI